MTSCTPRRSARLAEKRKKIHKATRERKRSLFMATCTPRRSERLTDKRKQVTTAFTPRRSERLAKKLKETSEAAQAGLRPQRRIAHRTIKHRATVTAITGPVKKTPTGRRAKTTSVVRRNASPPCVQQSAIDIPPVLLQMEKDCSDDSWLWMRWSGVPEENHTCWEHVLSKRGKFLHLACAKGDRALIEAVYEISKLRNYREKEKWQFVDAMHYAVEYGLYEMLPWIDRVEKRDGAKISPNSMLMNMALRGGNFQIAQWLYENRPKVRREKILATTVQALGRHTLDLLKWVLDRYPTVFTSATLLGATTFGNEQFLRHHGNRPSVTTAMDEAAQSGKLEIVRFLHENNLSDCTPAAMDSAAANGHIEIIRFLHENRTEGCTTKAIDGAARNGHLHVLEFLLENQRQQGFSETAIVEAATNGHLDVVQFLDSHRNNGVLLALATAMTGAAKEGRLEVLQYLFEKNQFPSDYLTDTLIREASVGRHTQVMHYLVAKASPRLNSLLPILGADQYTADAIAGALLRQSPRKKTPANSELTSTPTKKKKYDFQQKHIQDAIRVIFSRTPLPVIVECNSQ